MLTITYFVHCTTTDNEQKLATGQRPGKLSELGVRQAHELVKTVADQKFDAVICSDLKRAVDTANIVFGEHHNIVQDKRLREADYGELTEKPHSLFRDRMDDYVDTPFPHGESYRDVEKRLRSLCDDLKKKYDGKHVALVAHQAPQLALEVITKDKTWSEAIAQDWRRTGAFQPGWRYTV